MCSPAATAAECVRSGCVCVSSGRPWLRSVTRTRSEAVHTESETPSGLPMSSYTICQMCVYKWTNKHQHRSALEEDERDLGVRNEEEGQRLNHWFLTWGSQSLQGSQDKSDGSGDDEKRWESEHFFQSHSLFILFVFCILFFYCLNSRSGFISFF